MTSPIWIQSYGSKFHIVANKGLTPWSLCGINLLKDPVENPPDNKKCKKCLMRWEARE